MCTVILARQGPVDPDRDAQLLRATEPLLGLPADSLARPQDMGRPEFRLVEGVSRGTADQLAWTAEQLGYVPRVRQGVGIRWSSTRGMAQLVGGTVVLLALYTIAVAAWVAMALAWELQGLFLYVTPTLGVFLFVLVHRGFIAIWRLWLYLPLVVPAPDAARSPRTG